MGHPQHVEETGKFKAVKQVQYLDKKLLHDYVAGYIDRAHLFLNLFRQYGSPQYIIDEEGLTVRAGEFKTAFAGRLPRFKCYYAMKSNNHPAISEILLKQGYGIDVSSGWELKRALQLKASDIIFSGPGKTDSELALAINHASYVTVLMDSFGELQRLERLAAEKEVIIRAGIRLTTNEKGLWRKFGISVDLLGDFFDEAEKCEHVRLEGMQFHNSWNMAPENQVAFIERLGKCLEAFSPERLKKIEFVDIGGGFWPPSGEWLHYEAIPEDMKPELPPSPASSHLAHYHNPAVPINIFATEISQAVKKHLLSRIDAVIYAEPGRWVSHDAMHLLLRVTDKKDESLVITDAGTNMIGWERFESDYFPVINLTRPALEENECHVLGSLCTPHDVWGYAYFGRAIETGDVLLIPSQGAYTYSLRQQFIKPLPVVTLMGKNINESRLLSGTNME